MPELIKPQKNLPEKSKKKIESILAVCPDQKSFIIKFNPDFCAERYEHLNNIDSALKSGMIKLYDLQFAYQEGTGIDLLRAWLMNLSIYLGLDSDGNIIKDIARQLYSEIFMLNIAEFTLFFSRLKKGYYGSMYGRFDGMMICSAAREYRQQRGMKLSYISQEEQAKIL